MRNCPARLLLLPLSSRPRTRRSRRSTASWLRCSTQALANTAVEVGSVKLVYASLNGIKPDILRKITDRFRDTDPSIVAVFSTTLDGKASIAASCGKSAVEDGVHAGQLVKEICSLVGGSGGGRPDSAMGGASDIFKIDEAFVQIPSLVEKMLGSHKRRS